MVLEKILKRSEVEEEPEEEFVEIGPTIEEEKVKVRVDILRDYSDTERVQRLIREGNVVFLRIKDIRQRDITELKRCVDKLKKTCMAMSGDMVGVDEDFLVITPNFARIYRGKAV